MRVLVIEDDEGIRSVLCTVIETLGHQPMASKNVEEGIRSLSSFQPELIFLDLLIEGDVATPFIQVARDLMSANTPRIVVISAMRDAHKVAERHHVEFISKPFTLEDISDILDGKEARPIEGDGPIEKAPDQLRSGAQRESGKG